MIAVFCYYFYCAHWRMRSKNIQYWYSMLVLLLLYHDKKNALHKSHIRITLTSMGSFPHLLIYSIWFALHESNIGGTWQTLVSKNDYFFFALKTQVYCFHTWMRIDNVYPTTHHKNEHLDSNVDLFCKARLSFFHFIAAGLNKLILIVVYINVYTFVPSYHYLLTVLRQAN